MFLRHILQSSAFRRLSQKSHPLLRSFVRRWKAAVVGAREEETFLPLDPLNFWPDRPSSLLERQEGHAKIAEGYAFHTSYVRSAGGRLKFSIRLVGIHGTEGSLVVSLNGLAPSGGSITPKVKSFKISHLIANDGQIEISTIGLLDNSYAVMGILVSSDARAEELIITVTGADSDDAYLARMDAAKAGFLSEPGTGILSDLIVDREPTMLHPISQMCTAAQMAEPIYRDVCSQIGEHPSRHRKQWEFVYIIRALTHYGAIREGARGLGFGVGIEPLSSAFAKAGCSIVATDLSAEDQRAYVWNDTAQLGSNLKQIFHDRLCDEQTFFSNVSFRSVDMNAIPSDLQGFDFTWSSCAYEHLGSIEAGLDFFENSLKCLAPGGLAVHTTELNLTSNNKTLDRGTTVIFRRRDFEKLAARLTASGHTVIPITFNCGDQDLDRVIDLPPYSNDFHLKLALMRWVSTSFGLIVRKADQ